MAYDKTIWEAREGSQLNRFGKEQETSSSVLLTNQPKNITKKGTSFSTDNMNHIENGIYEAHQLIEVQTQDLTAHKTDDTAHGDIRQKINTEAQTREDTDASLQQLISTETQAREADVQNLKTADVTIQGNLNTTNENLNNLQQDFNAWIGRGGYLDAFDFGRALSMHDPADQQLLTDYALSQIPSLQISTLIWNGTKITNLFNGHTFILTNTQDTDPPILEWTDQGPSTIAPFDADTGGFIIGANIQDPDGTIERVPGSGGKGRVKGWEKFENDKNIHASPASTQTTDQLIALNWRPGDMFLMGSSGVSLGGASRSAYTLYEILTMPPGGTMTVRSMGSFRGASGTNGTKIRGLAPLSSGFYYSGMLWDFPPFDAIIPGDMIMVGSTTVPIYTNSTGNTVSWNFVANTLYERLSTGSIENAAGWKSLGSFKGADGADNVGFDVYHISTQTDSIVSTDITRCGVYLRSRYTGAANMILRVYNRTGAQAYIGGMVLGNPQSFFESTTVSNNSYKDLNMGSILTGGNRCLVFVSKHPVTV